MSAPGGFLNLDRDVIADALINGGAYQPFDNANGHLAVGDGTTAYAKTQTDLQGTSKARIPFDAGYPTRAANVLTTIATADGNTANFAWEEWGLANALTGGQVLCRFVESVGTKAAGSTWEATATLTVTLP